LFAQPFSVIIRSAASTKKSAIEFATWSKSKFHGSFILFKIKMLCTKLLATELVMSFSTMGQAQRGDFWYNKIVF
jgi:hypothetical protein